MDYWSLRSLRSVSTGSLLHGVKEFSEAVELLESSGSQGPNEYLQEMKRGLRMMQKELERREAGDAYSHPLNVESHDRAVS